MRVFPLLILLNISMSAAAQPEQALSPPPLAQPEGEVTPADATNPLPVIVVQAARPAPVPVTHMAAEPQAPTSRRRALEEIVAHRPRGLFHIGAGFGVLTQRSSSSGYSQLDAIGYDLPFMSLHINVGAQLVATSWLRIGADLAYEFTGDTTERQYRGQVRTDSTRFHMGLIDLSVTPYFGFERVQLGVRLAGGFGFSRWLQNSHASGSAAYRASAAVDVYIPMARRSANGLNIRVGYQLRRTTATGPLGLVFDQSSFFLNFAFMFGAGS